ncbi:winged helix-turn-helix transcriptional regulator [Gordonia sp. NPDC003424]
MPSYGQFCPVAKAMELLDERWTILVIRELLLGSRHFNELRRGVPKMSPALLTKRLRGLERAGVVHRSEVGGRSVYTLTEKGEELNDVVTALSTWGIRWIAELGDADLDPHLLLWDMRRTIPVDRWPRGRTTVAICFTDVVGKASSWWMVVDNQVEVCDFDPGYEVAASIRTDLRTLTRVWRGDVAWSTVLADNRISVDGASGVRRAMPAWIGQGSSAAIPRPA